jgi:HK97 family phage portal protein
MNLSWFSWKKPEMETKATNPYADDSFFGNLFTKNKYAGETVNYTTAMQHNDVYSCVRIKAESFGQLPMKLYRTDGVSKIEIFSGREHQIFTQKPNPYQTWQDFNEQYTTSLELLGKFSAEVKRNKYGNVYELVPFKHQAQVDTHMDDDGNVYYTYTTNDHKGKRTTQTYLPTDILFIRTFTLDGINGISTISQCALAIGTAIAGERHAGSLFENGAMPMGVLQTDDTFDDEAATQRLRQQWNEMHSGSKNSGKTAILEGGLTYNPITMTAVDAQLLEQRKFSREQIASMFRVPLHLLQASTGMKYANVEQNNISFFRDALMPLAQKLENHINQFLPKNHIVKMDEKSFVRGDRAATIASVEREIKSGVLSINEARSKFGYAVIDGGDVYAIKTNNLTFGKWEDLPDIQAAELAAAAKKTNPPSTEEDPDDDDPEKDPDEEDPTEKPKKEQSDEA